jgi:serpin B
MVILVPRDNYSTGHIIKEMNAQSWSLWMSKFSEQTIHLKLPKFKLAYEQRLNDALIHLGMGIAFDPSSANFAKINPSVQMYIGFVQHKSFIDVNEEGTEAAAVTVVGIEFTTTGNENTPYLFNVNRPFLMVIKERDTQAIIFIGKVMEPFYEN